MVNSRVRDLNGRIRLYVGGFWAGIVLIGRFKIRSQSDKGGNAEISIINGTRSPRKWRSRVVAGAWDLVYSFRVNQMKRIGVKGAIADGVNMPNKKF